MDKELLQSTVSKVLDEMRQRPIPLGVSNRHIHLSAQDYERLFPGHPISEKKSAAAAGTIRRGANRHPGGTERAAQKCAPARPAALGKPGGNFAYRCENAGDCRAAENVRQPEGHTGHPPGQPLCRTGATFRGYRRAAAYPYVAVDALILRVSHGDRVSVAIEGDDRGLIFNNVAIRVSPDMRLEMHIDTDEANAAGADNPQAFARLVGPR